MVIITKMETMFKTKRDNNKLNNYSSINRKGVHNLKSEKNLNQLAVNKFNLHNNKINSPLHPTVRRTRRKIRKIKINKTRQLNK